MSGGLQDSKPEHLAKLQFGKDFSESAFDAALLISVELHQASLLPILHGTKEHHYPEWSTSSSVSQKQAHFTGGGLFASAFDLCFSSGLSAFLKIIQLPEKCCI